MNGATTDERNYYAENYIALIEASLLLNRHLTD